MPRPVQAGEEEPRQTSDVPRSTLETEDPKIALRRPYTHAITLGILALYQWIRRSSRRRARHVDLSRPENRFNSHDTGFTVCEPAIYN